MKQMSSAVRFYGAFSPREELIGILSYPIALDSTETEFTRFCMIKNGSWTRRDFESDIVGVIYRVNAGIPEWKFAGKRGDMYTVNPSGITSERIKDAGTGPQKYGYLSCLKAINSTLYTCGFSRQIYRLGPTGWEHYDKGILDNSDNLKTSLEDIAGNSDGTLCSVGFLGEIAICRNGKWKLYESPTNLDLHCICADGNEIFYAGGSQGTILRGTAAGFEIICSGDTEDTIWDIQMYQNEPVASTSNGLFIVRNNSLAPFNAPPPPKHVGYKICVSGNLLWSIGTHHVFCLTDGKWQEYPCPDNN